MQSAVEEATQAWFEKLKCNMEWLRQYFNIKTEDILKRLGNSLIPFNPKFIDLIESSSPDVYGPFWVYTTLIFVIAAAGSISSYFSGLKDKGFFQEFIPISAIIVIYYFNLDLLYRFWGPWYTYFNNEMFWD